MNATVQKMCRTLMVLMMLVGVMASGAARGACAGQPAAAEAGRRTPAAKRIWSSRICRP